VQTPAWQKPIEHTVKSGFSGFEQAPVFGLQMPAKWHSSDGVHWTGIPAQVPLLHASPLVQGLLSSHGVPSGCPTH
jgi:hypothetical protein